jgi:hypothetical protein
MQDSGIKISDRQPVTDYEQQTEHKCQLAKKKADDTL